MRLHRPASRAAPGLLLAFLAACGTTPTTQAPSAPGTVTHIPPGNAQRDGPEANPPPNLDAVPDAVPQIEPIRIGGPNKPYAINGQTYVPLTDDRAVTEKGLASWYGKKFHGHRTASGEAYNMYAMTAAHKTLPIPSYARVRNPANGHEVIVRVNDRGPFSSNRVIDLSYTAALKLGVLGGVQTVEIERITGDDIRTGAAFRHGPNYAAAAAAPPTAADAPTTVAVGDLDRPARVNPPADGKPGFLSRLLHGKPRPEASAASAAVASGPPQLLPPVAGDVVASAVGTAGAAPASSDAVVDLGSAAAADAMAPTSGTITAVTTERLPASAAPAGSLAASQPAPLRTADSATPSAPPVREPRDEQGHAETAAGTGWWVQIGAYKQRDGALDFQHRLVDEQPWLAPLLAVFTDHGLNKLQAGPYRSRADAKSAADRIRLALDLVPTIVQKR